SYIQPKADGFDMTPSRDLIERDILTASIGAATPRLGLKSVEANLPVEFRASGVEGGDVDFAALLESALGAKRSITTTTTTKAAGNTGSVLQIEDADISKFNVGDIVVVKEPGGHWPVAITAKTTGVGTATITVSPSKTAGSFSASVVISKSQMYYTANSGHPALSLSYYWANEILEKAIGCKVKALALDGFETGGTADLKFGLEGLSFDQVDGAAPHTPTYDTGLPPLILKACVFKSGTDIAVNKVGLNLANTLAFITSTCSPDGKISSRVTKRVLNGTLDPYKDDTSVAYFTEFNAGTEFSIFLAAYIPSGVAGEITMGSVVGIYLPKCIMTSLKVGDKDDVLIDDIAFQAVRGADGQTEEMYLGFI
ncbi:MAG: hypothetical protein HOO67_02690, partial [Candidatus Peribacteraceae bacterium]|nr:hypothetical protein [Candidatus Peribacteraceae bacterium]